jgi:ankyrin repeat protein
MNYEKEYLNFKVKYKKLKKLIGGADPEKSSLIEKLNDCDKDFTLEDLESYEYNKLESEIDIPDEKGNLPIQIYIENGGKDQDILEYLLPSTELYTHQNNNGDSILITATKIAYNEKVIVFLWFKVKESMFDG